MIIIIPGWKHTAADWQSVTALLETNGHKVVILDIPSFGTSVSKTKLETFDETVAWCKNQIESLVGDSIDAVHLFGHSYGGRIALRLVSEGLQVEKLLLCGSPNLYRPSISTKCKKAIAALLGPIKTIIPLRIRKKLRSADYENVIGTELESLFLDVISDDQTNLLPTISTPTILIWGKNDEAAPVWIAKELQAKIADSTLDIIPNAGHNLHLEKPQLLAAKINAYATTKNN